MMQEETRVGSSELYFFLINKVDHLNMLDICLAVCKVITYKNVVDDPNVYVGYAGCKRQGRILLLCPGIKLCGMQINLADQNPFLSLRQEAVDYPSVCYEHPFIV